jgi:four helix bundle protein
MTNNQIRNKKYNLEDRTLDFAKKIISLCQSLPNNTVNFKLIDQLIRAASSIGANYIEANEALGKKDFLHRLRIARKESKETLFWLQLVLETNKNKKDQINDLIKECNEIRNILSAIINRIEMKNK